MGDYYSSYGKERKGVLKWIFWSILIVVILSLVGWGIHWLFLPTQVLNPDEGLARWRWFYDQYQAINATKGNIQIAQNSVDSFLVVNGNLNTWDWQQRSEFQRLTTVRDGYIIHYNNMANDYNAKMDDITRNWSAPPDLPRNIPNWEQ